MKNLLKTVLILFIFAACANNSSSKKNEKQERPAKYVFYFIGDGFSFAQAHIAEAFKGQKNGNIYPDTLFMNTFPVHGTYTTYAENRFITGSAAAGTALSSGQKTSINTISMSADHKKELKTIAEIARDQGMKVGIVTSVSIDHATPASFYAHQPKRSMSYEIGLDLTQSNFNYFASGGFLDPYGKKKNQKAGADSTALPSVYEVGAEAGYRFIDNKKDFETLKAGDDRIVVSDPKPASGASLPYVLDQTNENFTLVDFTRKGIELLDNPNGFFMMVEGGKIDWTGHANDLATCVQEVLQFDEAIEEAYQFYLKHPDETLIVVCGDHETGGLSMGHSLTKYETYYGQLDKQKRSAEAFESEIKEYLEPASKPKFAEILNRLKEEYGFDSSEELKLTPSDLKLLEEAFQHTLNKGKSAKNDERLKRMYGSNNPLLVTARKLMARKLGADWTSFSHTALPCPSRAVGAGAELFYGYYDNVDLPKKMLQSMQLEATLLE